MAYELLATVTNGGNTSTLTVDNIDQGYKDLVIIMTANADNQNGESYIRLNNVSGNQYSYRVSRFITNSLSQSQQTNLATGILFQAFGNTTEGCRYLKAFINGYSVSGTKKPVQWEAAHGGEGLYQGIAYDADSSANTPITRIDLVDTTNNFSNSVLKVYGIK